MTPRISSPLGGIDGLFTRTLASIPPFACQFSLPFSLTNININTVIQKTASLSTPRGQLWFTDVNNNNIPALHFTDASIASDATAPLTIQIE